MPHIYLAPHTTSVMEGLDILCWDAHHRPFLRKYIDLRPITTQEEEPGLTIPQGYYLGLYEQPVTIPGSIYFGQDLAAVMSLAQKSTWKGLLNISETLEGMTFADAIWNTLTIHAEASGANRVRPLMPGQNRRIKLDLPGMRRDRLITERVDEWSIILANLQLQYRLVRDEVLAGRAPPGWHKQLLTRFCEKYGIPLERYRIFIPGDLPDEGIEPHNTTFTETWPTDGTTISSGQDEPWTEDAGDHVVSSGELTHNSGDGTEADSYCDTQLGDDDMYLLIDITGVLATDEHPFICIRRSASAQTYYAARWYRGDYQFYSRVSGTFTLKGSNTVSEPSVTYELYLEMDGTAYDLQQPQSTSRLSGTDTTITGFDRIGLRSRLSDHAYGSLEAGTLAGATPVSVAGNQPAASGAISVTYQTAFGGNQPAASGSLSSLQTLGRSVSGAQPAATGALTPLQTLLRALSGNQPNATGALSLEYLIALAGNQAAPSGTISAQAITAISLAGNQPAATGAISDLLYLIGLTGNQPAASGAISALQTLGISLSGNQPAPSGAITPLQTLAIALAGSQPAASGTLALLYLIGLTGNQPAPSGSIASEAVTPATMVLPVHLRDLGDSRHLSLIGDMRGLRDIG